MAIDKALPQNESEAIEETESVEVAIVNPEAVAITTDDGGMVIDFERSLWCVPPCTRRSCC